jgi:hypothetical protein
MQTSSSNRLQMLSLIEGWKGSGLSQKAYCRQHQITYCSFHYWYKVYRDQNGEEKSSRPAFVPLRIDSAAAARPLMELVLSDGKRLLFHHQPSVDFLKALL